MAGIAELSKEEQDLLDAMRGEEAAAEPAKEQPEKTQEKTSAEEAAKAAAKALTATPEKKEQKVVPLEALHEARNENKELRKELESMKGLVAAGDDKIKKFIDSVSKQAEAQAPKFEDDPAGNLKHENEQLRKSLGEIQAKIDKQEGSAQQQDRLSQHANFVSAREQAFAKKNPDYFQASEYVAAVWRDEFIEAGFKEADVPKLVFGKALAITSQATQSERDPAAAIYKIAKRYGFAAKQQPAPDKKPDGESKLKEI